MSEYKENTVGWWLSQLKEPLKSRIVDTEEHSSKPCGSLECAISSYLNCLIENSMGWVFWKGVYVYFFGGLHIDSQNFKDGFDLAHECDPWREDKAIVDPPKKTTKLFFYGGNIINPFNEPLTISPSGEMLSVIVEEDKIKELMNANPGIVFWPTNVGGISPEKPESWVDAEIRKYRDNIEKVLTFDAVSPTPEISNMEDLGSLADFHFPKIVKSDALPPNHFVGIGDDGNPFIGKLSTSIIPPTWEIEAPQRAVVGYEEPKPIDTIEKKHELRIKNLEAYNKYQAERNQQIMDLNPHVDFCDSEGNLVRPSRMTALEARVKELEDQLFKLLGSKNG